ncbi:MAG: hypothetical protein Q8R02_21165 [Hyphomonadaceae bacterium]|nr:hypothetical protein [Hyphomonadaceae bacterium]
MAGDRQTLIFWGAELDGAFRRRLERELGALQVRFADASAVDPDPDGGAPLKLAVLAAGDAAPRHMDLVVLVGAIQMREQFGALHLEIADIENRTRRWTGFCEQLAKKLDRASLAVPAEELEARLDEATRRAEEAERARADFELQFNTAARTAKQAEAALAVERARTANLERAVQRLEAISESTAFAISPLPQPVRAVLASAREHAWRSRLAAARAHEMADAHPDALIWKSGATYSGETLNKLPQGFGVIVFRDGGKKETARYAGAFEEGRRSGHGVGASGEGLVWTGEWKDNEACGFGLLETPDGARFEGEVAPNAEGAPKAVSGHTWPATKTARLQPHRPAAPALPSPTNQAAGG